MNEKLNSDEQQSQYFKGEKLLVGIILVLFGFFTGMYVMRYYIHPCAIVNNVGNIDNGSSSTIIQN